MNAASPTPYTPSASSLSHRARLAPLISQLRRVTPRVPFWHLAAHRIPTLWSLYRGLLKVAPSDEKAGADSEKAKIRRHVSAKFRQNRHLSSPAQTKEQLLKAERLMDLCNLARDGDQRSKAIVERYSRLIAGRNENESWERAAANAITFLRNRPIITGYFRPSLFNRALPRLKPQPVHITMMIRRRRKNRTIRMEEYPVLREHLLDVQREAAFEKALLKENIEPVFDGSTQQWTAPIIDHQRILRNSFNADVDRLQSSFPPPLIEKIQEAQHERHFNKLRERRREFKGEVLKRTIERANKGPPAHVLSKMTEEEKRLDEIARSNVSEVGYVGYAKMKRGWKLKEEDPWKREDGPKEKQEELKAVEREIEKENRRRREEWEKQSGADTS
ncbi:hypothetical protein BC629DRAFT_1716989 [Irpex lacteus]|nr:hypothetical protein BC629DRAFT_1716989 [Irpex lacteus]